MGNEGLTGRVLGGKFRLIRRIGTGGMGSVYQAVHLELEKKVAVKLLHQQMAPHQEVFQRFKREAKIACKLNHPHIIEVFDFDRTEDGIPYIIMEFLDGEDLEALLTRRRMLPLDQVMHLFEGICSAVQQAHEQGVIHRDLKPQNILLCRVGDRADFPKVLDFGISKLRDANSIVTQTKAYLGTPCFMAPEQARGEASEASPQSDIFALGAMLYRALGGRLPFSGDSIEAVLYKIIHDQPTGLDKINDQVSGPVARVVHRAMAKDPQLRHTSVREMWRALVEAAGAVEDRDAPAPKLQIIQEHPQEPQAVIPLSTTNRKAPPLAATRGYSDAAPGQGAAPALDEEVPALDSMYLPPDEAPALHQPGGVSTLSASMGEHLDQLVRPRRPRWMTGALVVGVLLVAGLLGGRALLSPEEPSPATVEPTPVAAAPAPAGVPAPIDEPAPAAPARVRVELLNVPAGSEVTLNGQAVSENPFSLAAGATRHKLEVKGPHGASFSHTFSADKDLTIAVALSPAPRPRPRPRPRPAPVKAMEPPPKYGQGTVPMDMPTKPTPKPEPKPEPPKVKEYGEGTMPLEL